MEPLPDSAIAREAEGLLRDSSSPSLVNHCLRSYLWAVALAGVDGLAFDSELLFVAAALHDLGLEPAFDSGAPFEVDGGRVAAAMATEHGWVDPAADAVERAIVLHVAPNVTPDDGIEAYLLNESTGTDVSGHRLDELDQSWISAVMRQSRGCSSPLNSAACSSTRPLASRPDGRLRWSRPACGKGWPGVP